MDKFHVKKIIDKYVREFFDSDGKELISDPYERIYLIDDIYVSRKSLKYITHSRKHDNYDIEKVVMMVIRAGNTVYEPELRLPNHNKKYPTSKISTKLFDTDGALLVIHLNDEYGRRIFNAFYRGKEKYLRMTSKFEK